MTKKLLNRARRNILRQARRYWFENEYDEAINSYTEAIKISPDDALAYCGRGDAYYQKGEYDKAIIDYTEMIRVYPDFKTACDLPTVEDACCRRGDAYFKKMEYDNAIHDYNTAIKRYLDDNMTEKFDDIYVKLLMFPDGYITRYPESKKFHDRYIEMIKCHLDSDAAIAYGRSQSEAYPYYRKEIYANHISGYTETIRLNPGHLSAYMSRGVAYAWNERYDEAISDFTEVIKLGPKNVDARYYRQLAYTCIKRYDLAIHDFNEIIKIDATGKSHRETSLPAFAPLCG